VLHSRQNISLSWLHFRGEKWKRKVKRYSPLSQIPQIEHINTFHETSYGVHFSAGKHFP
jgi:hypothetical protein